MSIKKRIKKLEEKMKLSNKDDKPNIIVIVTEPYPEVCFKNNNCTSYQKQFKENYKDNTTFLSIDLECTGCKEKCLFVLPSNTQFEKGKEEMEKRIKKYKSSKVKTKL